MSTACSPKKAFQSTLPYGSDHENKEPFHSYVDFNPRSLTGATELVIIFRRPQLAFQSTLPYGSDASQLLSFPAGGISIHAPLRERRKRRPIHIEFSNFNPRSLTGATLNAINNVTVDLISIHAPLRERQHQNKILLHSFKSSIYCEQAQFKSAKILF